MFGNDIDKREGPSDAQRRDGSSEPNWRVIVDAMLDPAVVLDQYGAIVHHNPLVADLYPRARVGQALSTHIRMPELLQAIDNAAKSDKPLIVQLHDRVPVFRRLTAIVTALGVEEHRGGTPSTLVVFRDVTDQEKHAQMRSDFIANASHELRTPLASLKIIVETLQGKARNDEAARERFLAMMLTESSRMTRLIDDLLSLSRAEMKVHLPPRDNIEVCELLGWVIATLEPLASANSVTLSMQRGGIERCWVRGEREELAQVFLNLVQNGIKYGRTPGKVTIHLRRLNRAPNGSEQISITVEDNGIGIAPEHLPRLTERFYRVNAAASREKGGTGLGLAIVKYIVSRHRGDLSIESRLGSGSKFTVTLPLVNGNHSDAPPGDGENTLYFK